MNRNEAVVTLRNLISIKERIGKVTLTEKRMTALRMALESLECEKDIPKNPKEYEGVYLCPDCDEYVSDVFMDYRPRYCNECGQALDWSEVE